MRSEGHPAMYLVIGDTPAARRVCATVRHRHGEDRVIHLVAPRDDDLARALEGSVTFAAILIRDDVAALRYALALAHLQDDLPLAVTIFDLTIAQRLRELLPHAVVESAASVAVPSLLGPCLEGGRDAAFTEAGERVDVALGPEDGVPVESREPIERVGAWRRLGRWLRIEYRHQDAGTRLLVLGVLGLAAVLVADLCWLILVEGHGPVESLAEAARVLTTVGPGPDHPEGAYAVLSAVAMLVTMGLTALFTAGLVDRLLQPRLVRFNGNGAVPRSGHVVVVGLGQVGLRLCEELRAHGQSVVAVERDRDAVGVSLARQARIPVVIGDGTSRRLLEGLGVARCRVLAAVGSFDLDNVAVAVAVSAVSPSTRVVMRAGEQEAVSETRSLLPLGVTRDVTAIGAAWVVGVLTRPEQDPQVVATQDCAWIRTAPGEYVPAPVAGRDDCGHVDDTLPARRAPVAGGAQAH